MSCAFRASTPHTRQRNISRILYGSVSSKIILFGRWPLQQRHRTFHEYLPLWLLCALSATNQHVVSFTSWYSRDILVSHVREEWIIILQKKKKKRKNDTQDTADLQIESNCKIYSISMTFACLIEIHSFSAQNKTMLEIWEFYSNFPIRFSQMNNNKKIQSPWVSVQFSRQHMQLKCNKNACAAQVKIWPFLLRIGIK